MVDRIQYQFFKADAFGKPTLFYYLQIISFAYWEAYHIDWFELEGEMLASNQAMQALKGKDLLQVLAVSDAHPHEHSREWQVIAVTTPKNKLTRHSQSALECSYTMRNTRVLVWHR